MRFLSVFSSLMFLAFFSPAFAGITVLTQPKAVTVFPDSARVTREGSLPLSAGTHRVLFPGLPASVIESSLRLTVEGPHGTKLYGVALRKEFTDDVVEEKTRLLKNRLLALQDQKTDLADQVEARKTEIEILKRLAKENTEHATQPGLVRPGTIVDFTQSTKNLGQRITLLMAAVRKDERTMRALDDKMAALNNQMAEGSEPVHEKRAAEADLELPEAGTARFSLTYQVSGASWIPLYDLRLTTEGIKPRMNLDFNAGIRQTTGENWKGVSLTLCTSRPMEGTQVPDPTGWWLDFLNEARGYMDRAEVAGNARLAPASEPLRAKLKKSLMNKDADLEETDMVTAQTIQSAYAMSFSVPVPRDIPSDGSDHRVGIAQNTHDVQLTLVAVPRLSQAAYLEAKVTYGGEQTLLPGQAQLFRDGDFVGNAFLEAKTSGETFDLGFGQDDRIKVERKIASQTTGHGGFLSAKGERKYRWITTLSNFHSGNRLVEVREQLPRSQQKDIKVEATEILPQPQKEDGEKLGLICWKLDLKPKEKAKLTFAYKVDYPEKGQVVGLE